MTQPNWTADGVVIQEEKSSRLKFFVAGGLIIVALIALIAQAVSQGGQFFITVDEYYANPAKYADREIKVGAWVIGDTIEFTQIDAQTSRLEFDVVDDLANPTNRLRIVAFNEPLPDLLQHEAQALVGGTIGEDGALYASPGDLLLKCPTRYEEGEEVAEY